MSGRRRGLGKGSRRGTSILGYGGRQWNAPTMSVNLPVLGVSSLDCLELLERLLAFLVVPGVRQYSIMCLLGMNLNELCCMSVKDSDSHDVVRALTSIHLHRETAVSKAR